MLNLIKKSFVLLTAVGVLAIGAMAFANGVASAATNSAFTASYSGKITFSPCAQTNTCGPTDVFATLAESGTASNLGHVTTTGKVRGTGPQGCGMAANITDTMTAANGDLLFVHVDMTMCPAGNDGIYAGNGTYTVTGGTGRFAKATGTGVFQGIGDFAHSTITCNLSGTLSYQAS